MILWFSGTGNSAAVVEQLSMALGDKCVRMDLRSGSPLPSPDENRIIWVMPVHSWGMPKAVEHYMRHIDIRGAKDARHFLVATCGDDAGLIHRRWRKALNRRDWRGVAAHTVEMPNTYVLLPGFDTDTPARAETKVSAMPERIKRIAHAIKCSSNIDDVVKGRFAWIKTYIIYPFFMRFMTSPHPFAADENCISCKKCEKICPLGNISIADGKKPKWGDRCTLCLGCYHVCPKNAVCYGKASYGKGQWQGEITKLL